MEKAVLVLAFVGKLRRHFLLLVVAMVLVLLLSSFASPLSDEGQALMKIKASFSNVADVLHDWDDLHNDDFCSWRGVLCDNVSLTVFSLNLSSLNLGGEISPAIGDLVTLQSIDLQGNKLTGQIPDEIGNCAELIYLNLKSNQLTGPIPSTLTQIPNLKTLDLARNRLTGEIPRLLYWNEVLQYLDVRGNNLTGTIPDSIGNCTNFAILDLSYNQISGEIPYNIGFLQVATLSLQGNRLTGKIPEVFGLMQALAILDLSENELIGPIPPILGNLSYTGKLYLHGNMLTGTIPPELGNMSRLSYLQLNDNQVVGQIPDELGKLKHLFELNLANNHLEGSIPLNISSCTAMNKFNVHGNHLSGSIPLSFSSLGSLTYLDLSSNNFSGYVPGSVGYLEHLLTLNLSHNSLEGPLPAEFGNLRSIQIFDMAFNYLSGSIPPEIGQLQNLASLILNNNDLSGKIPDQLTNCLSLNFLGFFKGCNCLSHCWYHHIIGHGPPKLVILHMGLAIHTFDDIMRVTENLNAKYIVGYGASGTVYKCALKNSRPIAIKRPYNQHPHNSREFETELETIGNIRHRNLVTLHGYALTPNGNLLFYDYMENGSLWDLLHGPLKKVKLDWEARLRIAMGAAEGLAYLHHDCNPRIIHRDIKSSNILLDENFEARLSDFGIAKCLSTTRTHVSTFVLGTIGYIDPEYARTSRLNEKSDVYSFGIVLLELLTGKKAVDNDSNLHHLILSKADNNTIMETVDPEVSITCMDLTHVKKTFQLALLCTKRNPSERPTMHEVARVLASLLPAPPSKNIFVPSSNTIDYAQFVIQKVNKNSLHTPQMDQWFVRFEDVVSNNSL
ncbi:LRR receptor-like serine/threonine-protein kinase ERL2 [Glycine max]|nr:LRR receptor-like serine/threonine-protein kinase ERL2 [Glycine max]